MLEALKKDFFEFQHIVQHDPQEQILYYAMREEQKRRLAQRAIDESVGRSRVSGTSVSLAYADVILSDGTTIRTGTSGANVKAGKRLQSAGEAKTQAKRPRGGKERGN